MQDTDMRIATLWTGMAARDLVSGVAPSEADIAIWLARLAPMDVRREAAGLLAETMTHETDLDWDDETNTPVLPADSPEHRFANTADEPVDFADCIAQAAGGATPGEALSHTPGELDAEPTRSRQTLYEWMGLSETEGGPRYVHALTPLGLFEYAHVDDIWLALSSPRPTHPLAPILIGYSRRRPVGFESRQDWRIVPSTRSRIRAGESPLPRLAGQQFGGLIDGHNQGELPLFVAEADPLSVPFLDLVDIQTGEAVGAEERARGAPIAARLVVRAAMSIPEGQLRLSRDGDLEFDLVPSVGELMRGLLGPSWQDKFIGRDWPRVEEALRSAHSRTITLQDGRLWFFLRLKGLPALSELRKDRDGILRPVPHMDDVVRWTSRFHRAQPMAFSWICRTWTGLWSRATPNGAQRSPVVTWHGCRASRAFRSRTNPDGVGRMMCADIRC